MKATVIFFVIIGIVGIDLLLTLLGVWLWGVIAVSIFGLPQLTFWQFFGLTVLLEILCPKRFSIHKGDKE